jgi:hypothetical protein
MEKVYEELPVTGLHMNVGAAKLLYHERPKEIIQRFVIDKHAYFKQLNEVRQINKMVWENSDTKLPAELYTQYRLSKGVNSFRSLDSEKANLKVRDSTTGNSFWAQDIAQIVQGLGRMVDRKTLEDAVVEVDARYIPIWKRQLEAFGTGKVRKVSTTKYQVYEKSQAVEQYNKFMKLMYVFPTASAAADFNKTTASNIDDAAKKHRMINGSYFRYYYDNRFVALGTCVAEQRLNGVPMNRFNSIKEASEVMGLPTYTVYRLMRNPTSMDKYGCTWHKIPKN